MPSLILQKYFIQNLIIISQEIINVEHQDKHRFSVIFFYVYFAAPFSFLENPTPFQERGMEIVVLKGSIH